MEDLKILQKTYDMILYGNICLRQFPKAEKYALASDIKESMYALLKLIITSRLHLELNNKTMVSTVNQGVEFVGYRIWPTHRKLRKKTANRMKERMRYLTKAYKRGEESLDVVKNSLQSYKGMMQHANCYNLQCKTLSQLVLVRH